MTDTAIPPVAAGRADSPRADSGGSPPRHEQEIEALVELHTRLLDTLDGYDKIIEKAEPEFQAVAEEFAALHRGQSRRIAAMLVELGQEPDGDGSVFGSVNRAMVEVRSWFDDIGHNVMDALRQGEKHVHDGFEAAIAASPSVERRGRLEIMRKELLGLMERHAPPAM